MTSEEISWVGSLLPLGAFIGGQFGGILMIRLGRKDIMLAASAMYALSFFLLVVASDPWFIYFGRFLIDICTGIASLVCPVYVGETSMPQNRGFLGSCVQGMLTVGVLLGMSVGSFQSWRWLSVVCILCSFTWSSLLLLVPESPIFLLCMDREVEARDALLWLRDGANIEEELLEIKSSLKESSRQSSSFKDLFKAPNLAPFTISMFLMLGQQLSGINAVVFYVVDIFEASGTKLDSNLESCIVGVVQVVSTFFGAFIMDKTGRRMLLCSSSSIMAASAAGLGAFFFISKNENNSELAEKLGALPVVSMSLFIFAFSIGFGPIPWLMMSELFSPEIRGQASSLAVSFNWILAFLVTKFFTNIVDLVTESVAFWIFMGISIIVFIFCLFFVPETKVKKLDEIQQMFQSEELYFLSIWRRRFL